MDYTMKSWPGDVSVFFANVTRFSKLGFAPRVPWAEGLARTVRYLLTQR
jgi:hypothetical protein